MNFFNYMKNKLSPIYRVVIMMIIMISAVRMQSQPLDSMAVRLLVYNLDTIRLESATKIRDAQKEVLSFERPQMLIAQGVQDSVEVKALQGIFFPIATAKITPYPGRGHSVIVYDSTRVSLLFQNVIPTAHLPMDELMLFQELQ